MNVYAYPTYADYKAYQERGNAHKIGNVWAREDNIEMLSRWLLGHVPNLQFGICHGTRRGKEQEWFRKHLGIEVIGTEIASSATQFQHTIQWDFHEVKPEWIDAVDFIYSNSLDHSYQPRACLDAWMRCVRKTGACIIEWSRGAARGSRFDPFSATEEEYAAMFAEKYVVLDNLPGSGHGGTCTHFVVGWPK